MMAPSQSTTQVRWAVLAGRVSPYMRELWAKVAARGQGVLFVEEPWPQFDSFDHERGSNVPAGLDCRAPAGWGGVVSVARDLVKFRPRITVTLSYSNPRAIALSVLTRAAIPRALRVVMNDTNGVQMQADLRQVGPRIKLLGKRFIVGTLFQRSFDLGWSNGLANRMLGVRGGEVLPLYSVDFGSFTGQQTNAPDEWKALRRPILLCVARAVPVKNLGSLVEVWKGLCAKQDRGSVLVIGGGPELERLIQMASAVPRNRLLFAGPVGRNKVPSAFRLADALVLPSLREPWGIVVTEALGCGLPVLASEAVGAAVSLARDFPEAVRIHRATRDDLAAGIADLLKDLPSRREAALAAAPLVRDVYDMDRVAERLAAWGETATRAAAPE